MKMTRKKQLANSIINALFKISIKSPRFETNSGKKKKAASDDVEIREAKDQPW
jgi:hypothetical protein